MSKQFETIIVEKLLKKYERSKISKEGSNRNLAIRLSFDEKNMPKYVLEDSYLYEKDIEETVAVLHKSGFIDVKYDFNKRIKEVQLNLDKVEECYKLLNKESLKENRISVMSVLEKYKNKGKLTSWYVSKIEERIAFYKPTTSYFKNVKDLEEVLFILDRLEYQIDEISIRNFSAKYLKDSKRMEVLLSKLERILHEYFDSNEKEILSRFNVFRNPTFLYIKGMGKFKINNQIIDLKDLKSELILSSNHVDNLQVVSLGCTEVITVENLTTFYDYPSFNRCIIYLGGFHNKIRKKLLCKLYEFNRSIPFYHFGDIDAGGFYILNHLIEDTKIPFKTMYMDVNTLKKYSNETIPLTKEDQKRLKQLLQNKNLNIYKDVFMYMLEHNIKLEQENIIYD